MPVVSVIIPSYNHERFVKECIQSVLEQTFQDFEIIITDDASTDHTVDVIKSFDDPRIISFEHDKNMGVSVAANHCLEHASGNYIAWLSSDDIWYPEKLSVQVKFLDEHPEVAAVFGKVDWIDESGNAIVDFPYLDIFNVENRTRYEWLRYFFLTGNCLSMPCSMVRKECYAEVGTFNPVFAGIPDLDLWVRICFKHDIMILDQKLLKNRWIGNESNASGDTTKNNIRNRFEYGKVLDHFLQIEKPAELSLIFPEAAKYGAATTNTIPYFLARIAIASGLDFRVVWGLDVIYRLIQDEKEARILEDTYGFAYRDFIELVREHDPFKLTEISAFARQIFEKDQAIRSLMEQISRREQDIKSLTAQVSERDREISELREQAALTDRAVEDMQGNPAVRLTLKYRHLVDYLFPLGTRRRRLFGSILRAQKIGRSPDHTDNTIH